MNSKLRFFTTILCVFVLQASFAQNLITIDHKTQRFINDVSTLDRTKYVNAHITIRNEDPVFDAFKKEYNVHPDYIGSRSFWNPVSKVKNGNIPKVKSKYSDVRKVDPFYVTSGVPKHLFYDKTVDYSEADVSEYSKDLSVYLAQSLAKDWDNVTRYFEPMNEPMVHAKDFYPGNKIEKTNKVITKICEYHKDMAQAIHNTPELKNIQVMGYASAYPEFEKNNFKFWNNRYKKFIDVAGEDVDIFSIHLYDGKGLNNAGGRRSGSNSEALLDIIEAYSYKKLGVVKPLAVTEYGRLVPNQPNWKRNAGIPNYDPVTNSQAVRSQIHLVMNFMERADHFVMSIPFSTNRREDNTFIYAKATLWTKNEQGKVELSMRKYFYEMLKDLKGERIRIHSDNVDIQTQAFVDGKQLYVMLNNLNDDTQEMNLQLLDQKGLKSVDIKRLKVYVDKVPELSNTSVNTAPENISLEYGETAVLTYNFKSPISFTNKIVSKKYYTNDFLQSIEANQSSSFIFDPADTGSGMATLRLGVGRDHGLSLTPEVMINGKKIAIEGDIIRGNDQVNRSQFFGVLEIPFSIDLLNEKDSNTVEVTFPDSGGKISSAILQVQKADKPLK
ncbi:MAG: hypothetical protein AAGA66_00620 [Bacteroidota bacterium]